MDPIQQTELSRVLSDYVHQGKYLEIAVFLGVLYLPFVPAIWKDYRNRRQVKQLYNDRLSDKDKEIERLAQRIKDLENASLKTVRRK